MTALEIKDLVDAIGQQHLAEDYSSLFTSEVKGNNNSRYSLKVKASLQNEPEELTNTRLKVRMYSDYAGQGQLCKELGICGRYMFDKLDHEKNHINNVYLSNSNGGGYGEAKKEIIDHFGNDKGYSLFIDEPHFVTVLNFHDLPERLKREKIELFISEYFRWFKNSREVQNTDA